MYGISNSQQQGGGGSSGGGSINYTKIESTIPTTAWVSSAPSWIGQNALTWTEKSEGRYYVQGGTEDLGLSAGGSYSAMLTIDGTDYSADVEGILPAGGTSVIYAGYFNNNNIELNIIDHCVGFDDNGETIAGNGYLVMVIYMRGTFPSSVIVKSFSAVGGISAIISNSAIKVNSAVTMYIDYNGKIKAGEKADGSITVSADETPTENIPYTLQVVETSAEGAFEIVNSYVPNVPETPTALPQEASALKSGELPTSAWGSNSVLWTGSVVTPYNSPSPENPNMGFLPYTFANVNDMLAFYGTKDNWSIIIDGNRVGASSFNVSSTYPSRAVEANFLSGYNCYVRIFVTGAMACWYNTKAGTITEVSNTKLAKPIYTISDTSITANSDVLMELTDDGGVKSYSMEAGSITVIRDTVPTQAIPYTYKVKQTNASGQFTLVNHYVPSIPESPTSLPVLYKKASGELPTSGWDTDTPFYEGNVAISYSSSGTYDTKICSGDFTAARNLTATIKYGSTSSEERTEKTESFTLTTGNLSFSISVGLGTANKAYFLIKSDGIYAYKSSRDTEVIALKFTSTEIAGATVTYTISDTSITANTSVKMYLTDAGGVKAQSKASGSITVIRDTVPTTAIPYEYEVEQTSAEGLFEVINAYVPTKTSELTNDSGFITAEDIPSATTLYEDSTGAATVTLSETINNGDIVRIKTNNGNVDHYYIGVAWNRAITVTESLMVTDESDVTVGTAINIYSLRFNIQDTSLILFHYFNTNITTAGAVTITNEKTNVVIRKVERIHT